ncbi:hypothetical protein F2Q69_00034756 [Brassica cretica]|uniref:Uncharacterized protein n=1 Tax=Brassica cretica TaxID=69181 RepID=A0A8S9SWG8_BRACR|nr:hypothetical protein F2Q69_00034756 [Brassica cretica]
MLCIRDVAVDLCHRPLLVATRSMKVQDFGSIYLNASGKSCFMDLDRSSSSPKKLHRRIETEAAPHTFSLRTPLARSPIRKSSQFTLALVIFLGDYCDCGPETRKVIDFLISLPEKHRSKPTSFSPLTRARIKPVSFLETAPTSSSSSDVVDLASLEQSMESLGLEHVFTENESSALTSRWRARDEMLLRNLRAVDISINGIQAVLIVLLNVLYQGCCSQSLSSSSSCSHEVNESPRLWLSLP